MIHFCLTALPGLTFLAAAAQPDWVYRCGLNRWEYGPSAAVTVASARRATATGDLLVVLIRHFIADGRTSERLFYTAVQTPFLT